MMREARDEAQYGFAKNEMTILNDDGSLQCSKMLELETQNKRKKIAIMHDKSQPSVECSKGQRQVHSPTPPWP